MSHAANRVHLNKTMLRKHFGGQIYDAAREENDLRFYCLDVEVLRVNRNLCLITLIVQKLWITLCIIWCIYSTMSKSVIIK